MVDDDPVRGYSDPGRFWTLTNVGEATPDLLSPLCWSLWEEPVEVSFRRTLYDFGVLPRREVRFPADQNRQSTGCFYGRQAGNVDHLRSVFARLPGISADEFERDLMGSSRPGLPDEPTAWHRLPVVAVKSPVAMLSAGPNVRRVHAATRAWWEREVSPPGVRELEPAAALARLVEGRERFRAAMYRHLATRLLVQTVQGAITRAADRAGDPTLAARVFSGYGDLAETEVADDVWRLSRDRITLETFLRRHGYHGPNEGNAYTRSWREDPSNVLKLADTYRRRPSVDRPVARAEAAARRRVGAEAELLAGSPAVARPPLRFLFHRAANLVRNLELGKAAFLMGIDGTRAAARELGTALRRAGVLDDPDDAFFLAVEELDQLVHGRLPDARGSVARRRKARDGYRLVELPSTFHGMPEPTSPATYRERAAEVRGTAVGGGRAEGRARVVLSPNDDVELEDGDVLVCRLTDPSWAPLFTLAEALVIDVGGAASHGAVVARELGIPCVTGTGTGTRDIGDGDRIVVDGDTGVVTVLARVSRPGPG